MDEELNPQKFYDDALKELIDAIESNTPLRPVPIDEDVVY